MRLENRESGEFPSETAKTPGKHASSPIKSRSVRKLRSIERFVQRFLSVLPQKYFVERVAGDAVKVNVMVRPGMSPGSYDPTPQQMSALDRSAAFFRIGVAFEEKWLPQIQSANCSLRMVDTRVGIALQPVGGNSHSHGSAAKGSGRLDPHIWTAPRLVKQQAAVIRDALIEMRPGQRSRFEAGYASFSDDLDRLDIDIRRQLAGKKEKRFMVFHPAWGYFARDYGLQQIPIEVEGKEPGPQTLARIIDAAKADRVRVVFVQRQFSLTAAEAVTRAIGGDVVEIDPLAEDFLVNTRLVAGAFAKAME